MISESVDEELLRACLLAESVSLPEQKQLLLTMLASVSQGMIMVDPQGRIQAYNRLACELLDLPEALMLSGPHSDEIHAYQLSRGHLSFPLYGMDLDSPISGAACHHAKVPDVYLRNTHRGTVLEVKTRSLPSGGFVRTYADVTSYVEMTRALRASEQKLSHITSQLPGVVYRVHVSPKGVNRFLFVSPGLSKIYGIKPDELLADGNALVRQRHPDDFERMESAKHEVVLSRNPLLIEFRIIARDGTLKWVQMSSSVESFDESGVVRNGFIIDISKRKFAEAALSERDELWKLALESTGDGVWDWDVVNGTNKYSPRILDMYGYSAFELRDGSGGLDAHTHPDDLAQMALDRQAHFDGRSPMYFNERRIRCKDGNWKWIMSRGMVLSRDEQGRPMRMVGIHTDITQRKNAEVLIWQQANFDALTGLPNRRMLHDRLEQAIKRSDRDALPLAVLFIDLDHFKEINDSLGHHQGDALLMQAALRICQTVRNSDTVARMGGDEFTVILQDLDDGARVAKIASTLIERLQAPYELGHELAYVSASIGITIYPDDASGIDTLFKCADQAMYAAKASGRNRYSYYTPSLQTAAQNRARMVHDLRQALEGKQFSVVYQPVVALATGQVHKAEALIRWQHPTQGLIAPEDFIPVAETSGLIVDIGEWVFREAVAQVKAWRAVFNPAFQVSVNKSPAQFHVTRQNQAGWQAYLASQNVVGDAIVLEITEGMLLDANPHVSAHLLELKEAGVGVSLDDFGTGYSSLSYLQRYDIDYLKIDQTFVRGLAQGAKSLALCKAIISMAHELGIRVIAEGVETLEQRNLLAQAGCDYGQGFLFAKPLTAADFESTYLRAQSP